MPPRRDRAAGPLLLSAFTGQLVTGSLPVAQVIERAAAIPLPEPEELPRDILRLPGGSGNTTAARAFNAVSGSLLHPRTRASRKASTTARRLACNSAPTAREERERTGDAEVDVERTYRHPVTGPLGPQTGQVTTVRAHVALGTSAMRVVAEVDTELGIPRIVWIGAAQDVGRALNPQAVEGQIEGGTVQGLGLALMEEIKTEDGVIRNANFTDYLLSTALDVPPIVTERVEDAYPEAPYGMKGVGEPPTVVSPAAVVAALRDATGQPLTHIPFAPSTWLGYKQGTAPPSSRRNEEQRP